MRWPTVPGVRPKGIIELTSGNFYFGKPVEVPKGVFVKRGDTEPDRPTTIHYQEGADPVFPLFRGNQADAPEMACPACSHVLVSGLHPEQITGVYLECHCGEGLDLL